MKNQLKKINLHYAALQSLYWLGYATIWASRSVALAEKGCSNTLVGIISAVSLTSAALVFQPFMSAIADRSKSFTSRHFAMMLSVLAAIAALVNWLPGCTLLCSVIMYVVIGICMIGLAPFLNSMAMALVNKGVPVNYSFGRGIGSAFYAVGAFSMGFLLERFGTSLIYLLAMLAFLALAAVTLLFRYVPPQPMADAAVPAVKEGEVLGNLALFSRYPMFIMLVLGYTLLMSTHSVTCTYTYQIVARVGGTASDMGAALAIGAFVELPAMILFNYLRKRTSLRFLLRLCAFGFLLRNVLLLFAPNMTVIYITMALQFLECGLSIPSTVYYVSEKIDSANQVKGQSLLHAISNGIGSAAGSIVAGRLLDISGVSGMLLFTTACCVVGGIIIFIVTSKE